MSESAERLIKESRWSPVRAQTAVAVDMAEDMSLNRLQADTSSPSFHEGEGLNPEAEEV